MKRSILIFTIPLLVFILTGCTSTVSPNRFSQAQLTAIESRVVDASMDETFTAASSSLFDAGYTIAMSDRAGGIITGHKGKDNTSARIWISPLIQDTRFVISIQMRESGSTTTDVRIKTSINGEPTVDKEAIDQIWNLMQRQVLMRMPPNIETEDSSASAMPNQSTSSLQTARSASSSSKSNSDWITGKTD